MSMLRSGCMLNEEEPESDKRSQTATAREISGKEIIAQFGCRGTLDAMKSELGKENWDALDALPNNAIPGKHVEMKERGRPPFPLGNGFRAAIGGCLISWTWEKGF